MSWNGIMSNLDTVKSETREKLKLLIDEYFYKKNNNQIDSSEAGIRTWLDKFLSIFGWDVTNTNEIVQELTLSGEELARLNSIGSSHKRPDYSLMLGTTIKSFLDAKSLDINVFTDKSAAYQIRCYGWSARVPCSFVSNFEQLSIFDTRYLPEENVDANVGAVQISINEYLNQFDTLFEHLWISNIQKNILEKLYSFKSNEGKNTLDTEFTKMLSQFRLAVASNLYDNNIINSDTELNYFTQVILDRIIFVRVCESRGFEQNDKLKSFISSPQGFWESFKHSCYMEFYEHYEGEMFERNARFQTLILDNSVFEDFIKKLYYPYPYKFDVIPVKVLASIYEEFLSKKLAINGTTIIEETKEEYVRTNGAIPTPEHIVKAVCEQTIDFDSFSTIEDIFATSFLDPCCGSGVFLVYCFERISQRILEIIRTSEEQRRIHFSLFFRVRGEYYLNINAKRKIAICCLHGVDCDESACEVAKMSLALKIIDNENKAVLEKIGAFGKKLLRDIASNIKLGNSLVDETIILSPQEIIDIKPFDYLKAFEPVFRNRGGFDYIIGNPPYVETKHYKAASPTMHLYLSTKYRAFEGKADLAVLFLEKCLSLLNNSGKLGFIIQRRWFKTDYGKSIRYLINTGKNIHKLIDYKATNIFKGRITYVSLMVLTKQPNDLVKYSFCSNDADEIKTNYENDVFLLHSFEELDQCCGDETWSFESYDIEKLKRELTIRIGTIGDYPNLFIKDGIQALWKKMYHLKNFRYDGNFVVGENGFGEEVVVEKDATKEIIYNKQFYPFKNVLANAVSIFPYEDASTTIVDFNEIRLRWPRLYSYLSANELRIKENVECRNGALWPSFTREHNHDLYYCNKIIIPMTAKDTISTVTFGRGLYMDNSNVWFIYVDGASNDVIKAIACVVNSTIFSVLAKSGANPQSGGYYKFNKQFISPVPFPTNAIQTNENRCVNRLSDLYSEIIDLQNLYLNSQQFQRPFVSTQLENKWEELDCICNDIYGLSDEQIEKVNAIGRTVSRVSLLEEDVNG